MATYKRRKQIVDKKVQGALIRRAARYWLYSVAAIGSLTILGWIFVTPGVRVLVGSAELMATVVSMFAVAVAASFLLLPFVLLDLSRLTNRFAGPMFRLRRSIRQLAAGECVKPLHFRDGDYWQEVAKEFNALLERVTAESERRPSNIYGARDRPTDGSQQGTNGVEKPSTVEIVDAEPQLQTA